LDAPVPAARPGVVESGTTAAAVAVRRARKEHDRLAEARCKAQAELDRLSQEEAAAADTLLAAEKSLSAESAALALATGGIPSRPVLDLSKAFASSGKGPEDLAIDIILGDSLCLADIPEASADDQAMLEKARGTLEQQLRTEVSRLFAGLLSTAEAHRSKADEPLEQIRKRVRPNDEVGGKAAAGAAAGSGGVGGAAPPAPPGPKAAVVAPPAAPPPPVAGSGAGPAAKVSSKAGAGKVAAGAPGGAAAAGAGAGHSAGGSAGAAAGTSPEDVAKEVARSMERAKARAGQQPSS